MTGWDLGGESNSFSFDNVSDHVTGTVLDLAERQQTDMDSGQPAFWDDGRPKMMFVVTLQTELRDPANPADDGKRTVSLTGSKKAESLSRMAAVLSAVRTATGSTELQYGGKLTIQYVGDGQPSRRGFNPPKQYQAWYEPPAMQLEAPPGVGAQTGPVPPVQSPRPPLQQPPAAPQAGPQAPPSVPVPPTAPSPPAPSQQAAQPPSVPVPQQPPQAVQPSGPPASPTPAQTYTDAQIAGVLAAGLDPLTVLSGVDANQVAQIKARQGSGVPQPQ